MILVLRKLLSSSIWPKYVTLTTLIFSVRGDLKLILMLGLFTYLKLYGLESKYYMLFSVIRSTLKVLFFATQWNLSRHILAFLSACLQEKKIEVHTIGEL